ncbi:MAG TPA: DUF1998 domain-containing protein [Clostridia bacterium]|nr:DUF1998 domain-containing protein [Clostridia bacterium]
MRRGQKVANNQLGKLRRSSVVSTFGPGAIVDFRADGAPVSGVAAGLEAWDERAKPAGLKNKQVITEPRLQRKLKVLGFRLPPVALSDDDPSTLVGVRFPDWLHCPGCHRIRPSLRWGKVMGKAFRFCPDCSNELGGEKRIFVIPVRFVAACEYGHLEEFPWDAWVAHKEGCQNRKNLILKSEAAGLAGLTLRCPSCKASKSMDGIFRKSEFIFPCRGRRPWLSSPEDCNGGRLVAMQRGASNLYFPLTQSALSIPPWSDTLQEMLGTFWGPLVATEPAQRANQIEWLKQTGPLSDIPMSSAEIANALELRIQQLESSSEDLRVDEYLRFSAEPDAFSNSGEFELRAEFPGTLSPWVSKIRRVVRLREVRALTGFTRINPLSSEDTDSKKYVAPIAATPIADLKWLPAIDVRGEGIFVELNRDAIEMWQSQSAIIGKRASQINERFAKLFEERYGKKPKRSVTPKLLLIHTFAHALMRQLSLECGYSSASLRERLYVDDDPAMSGVLIFTATADSDGTLGGLSRQGDSTLLQATIRSAISSLRWCSSDPLCIEGIASLSEATNGAACHSCVLAPETSCEEFNGFLDRALLVGMPDDPKVGFFSSLGAAL